MKLRYQLDVGKECLDVIRGDEGSESFFLLQRHHEPITCAAWTPDGQYFVLGTYDLEKPLSIWARHASSTDISPMHIFKEPGLNRVQDCAVAAVTPTTSYDIDPINDRTSSTTPVRLVALCVDKKIHVYDYHSRNKLQQIELSQVSPTAV